MTAPIPIKCTRYQCPHCRRTWAHQDAAWRHIARCWSDPATRNCKTCEHFCKAYRASHWDPDDLDEPAFCAEGVSWDPQMPTQCSSWQQRGSVA